MLVARTQLDPPVFRLGAVLDQRRHVPVLADIISDGAEPKRRFAGDKRWRLHGGLFRGGAIRGEGAERAEAEHGRAEELTAGGFHGEGAVYGPRAPAAKLQRRRTFLREQLRFRFKQCSIAASPTRSVAALPSAVFRRRVILLPG